MEVVKISRAGKIREVEGDLLVEAQDGAMLLLAQDNFLWNIQPKEIIRRTRDERSFELFDGEQLLEATLADLPSGFQVYRTANYIIIYDTSRAYAEWCGSLYERLHKAFYAYWNRQGFKLEPSKPLVALVFRSRDSYQQYGKQELGSAANAVIGYYSLRTNRVATYDLTGIDAIRRPGERAVTARHVQQILSRPEAERTVATVIHEATHQLAFNSGLQTRYADIPVWLSEGLAIYFETPDMKSTKAWRGIGVVNRVRLSQFRKHFPSRKENSLITLTTADDRFRDVNRAEAAYAEAWALVYYLIRNHPKEFVAYLKALKEKPPGAKDTPETRLKEFQAAFGGDLQTLDNDFIRQIRRIR